MQGDDNFTELLDHKTKQILKANIPEYHLLYDIIDMELDTAQLWEDWDRQNRYKHDKDIRVEMKVNNQEGKINSVKFNFKKESLKGN